MISAKAKSTAPTPASTANLGGRRGAPPKHRARTRIAAGRGPELEFDVPGADSTQGRGINDSGQIVGSYGAAGHAPDHERSYARHGSSTTMACSAASMSPEPLGPSSTASLTRTRSAAATWSSAATRSPTGPAFHAPTTGSSQSLRPAALRAS